MIDVELLPCPFCGSTDALRLQNTHTASFWVSCCEDDGGCGAQATGQFFPGPNRRTRFVYNPEAPEGSTFEARTLGELPPEYRRAAKSAIAAWNRRANVAHATAAQAAEIEALREALDALKAENERLREALNDADNELDWLDEDMDTCDHSVGVCMCSYWSMRRKMKAALAKESSND